MRALILSLGLAVAVTSLVTTPACDKPKPALSLDIDKFGKDL